MHDIRDMERIVSMTLKKTKTKKITKDDKKHWNEQRAEAKRVQKLLAKQEADREHLRNVDGRGLEPTHAVVSCPDCAARLLIGINFVEHRV